MKHSSHVAGWFALFVALLQPAMAAPKPSAWPILEIASQAQCSWFAREATAHIFENEAQWQRLFEGSQTRAFKQAPDWNQQVVVALTLGVRPSSGISISLDEKQFGLRDEVLQLAFRERGPAPGDMVLEVMTQPCIFILTPRGNWRYAVLRNADSGAELGTNTPDPLSKARNRQAEKQTAGPKRR